MKPLSTLLLFLAAFACVATSAAQAAVIAVPAIEVQSLTHSFEPAPFIFFPDVVRDSIAIGDGNYTGGGAFTVASINNGDTATLRIQAPGGKKFVVHDSNANLSLNFYWQAGGDFSALAGGTYAFENLTGSPPPNTYSFLNVGNNGNVIGAQLDFQPAGLIEFTAIDITIPVQTSPSPGARNFGSVQSSSSMSFGAYAFGADRPLMSIESIPEPASLALLTAGAGMLLIRPRRQSSVCEQREIIPMQCKIKCAVMILVLKSAAGPAIAAPMYVDWTSFTPSSAPGAGDGVAAGVLDFSGDVVNVSYTGDVYSGGGLTTTVNNDGPYYSNGNYNPASPGLTDNISNDGGSNNVHTLTFDRAVTNPHFHVVSMGQPGVIVDWVFNHDFTVESGSISRAAPNTLRGAEDNGSIRFAGDYTQISWTTPVFENTTGFQFSVDAIAVVPELASLALLATGAGMLLASTRSVRRRRRR